MQIFPICREVELTCHRHRWDQQQKAWMKTQWTINREEQERKTKETLERMKALDGAKLE
jgi:hypothetical protein